MVCTCTLYFVWVVGMAVNQLNKPNKVIVHCLDTPDKPSKEGSLYDVEDVDQWHRDRGWDSVGYHWVITRDGILQQGRDEQKIGAHCYGQNENSLGVAYEGSYLPTMDQVVTFCDLYRQIYSVHKIDWSMWEPHYFYDENKECPGFPIEALRAVFRKLM